MKLTRPSEVRALLDRLQFKPSKLLGQNFLIDGNILNILLEAAELSPEDRVLEIGPGLGVVTEALLEKTGHVVAIEKDSRLAAHVEQTLGQAPGLTLIHRDATDVDLDQLLREQRLNKLVANLPYSVGSRILVDCFQAQTPPERMVVTVQKEVADRLAAGVNTSDYGLLSIWAQLDYAVTLHKVISPACFFPPPQIRSAIVLMVKKPRALDVNEPALFNRLVKAAFSARRKQIQTILQKFAPPERLPGIFAATGLTPTQRPESIPVIQWCRLANELG